MPSLKFMTRTLPLASASATVGLGCVWVSHGKTNKCIDSFPKISFFSQEPKTNCPYKISFPPKRIVDEERELDVFFKELENDFKQSKDLSQHVLTLRALLKKEETADQVDHTIRKLTLFLGRAMDKSLFNTLTNRLFFGLHPTSHAYPEYSKKQLLQLQEFFPLMEDYIEKINDPKLAKRVKIIFSNLPSVKERENYASLYLDNKEQLSILIEELQKQENSLTESICTHLREKSHTITDDDMRLLEKLIKPKIKKAPFSLSTSLSEMNRMKLEAARSDFNNEDGNKLLKTLCGQIAKLKTFYFSSIAPESSFKLLQRVSKCKMFFEEQAHLPPDQARIPFWYHSTKEDDLREIIKSKEMRFFRKKGNERGYSGAWVSTQVESEIFGRYTVAFTKEIEKISPLPPLHSLCFSDRRWRGFPQSIPFNHTAAILAIKDNKDKRAQREEKEAFHSLITPNGFPSAKIISNKQLCFLQREIESILGQPNLTASFWGWAE